MHNNNKMLDIAKMGYIEVSGAFDIISPLNSEQIVQINSYSNNCTRKYTNQPSSQCQWIASDDGTQIIWNGNQCFDSYLEWINYLIVKYFEPWGLSLKGSVELWGSSQNDRCSIVIAKNISINDDELYDYATLV
jgi:hypothetical protein